MTYSKHAKSRMQQRGVSEMAVDLLLRFGSQQRSGKGATSYYWDRSAQRRLKSYAGTAYTRLIELFNCYVVVSDEGDIITVAHRYR